MELERKSGVTEKDIHFNPVGIIKEYKEEHEKLANRSSRYCSRTEGVYKNIMNSEYFNKVTELEEDECLG